MRVRSVSLVYLLAFSFCILSLHLLKSSIQLAIEFTESYVFTFEHREFEKFHYLDFDHYTAHIQPLRQISRVLIAIASRPEDVTNRDALRKTWAHNSNLVQFYTTGKPMGSTNSFSEDSDSIVLFEYKFVLGNCDRADCRDSQAELERNQVCISNFRFAFQGTHRSAMAVYVINHSA